MSMLNLIHSRTCKLSNFMHLYFLPIHKTVPVHALVDNLVLLMHILQVLCQGFGFTQV